MANERVKSVNEAVDGFHKAFNEFAKKVMDGCECMEDVLMVVNFTVTNTLSVFNDLAIKASSEGGAGKKGGK